jgi:hypothetical protein
MSENLGMRDTSLRQRGLGYARIWAYRYSGKSDSLGAERERFGKESVEAAFLESRSQCRLH